MVECAVLGNEEVLASGVGEVRYKEDFYTYSENLPSHSLILKQ